MPILKPLAKRAKNPQPYLVWDVESLPLYDGEPINTKWLGAGLYDGRGKPSVEKNADRFFEHLLSDKYRGYYCYAHNGSGYDFRYLIAWLCRRGIPWQGFSAGSRLFITCEGREFLDSIAVLPMSLADACTSLGATHKKQSVPPDFYKHIERYDWQGYLADDLRALYDCIDILRNAVDALGGTLKRTLASTAVDLWQKNYLVDRYIVPGHSSPAEAAARAAYAGGRCEVFCSHIKSGEYWDRNSSYPTEMLKPVPVTVIPSKTTTIPDFGLVHGTFKIPHDEKIPPLFWRRKPGERLYHPTGDITGWRTADEARYVVSLYGKRAVKIHDAIAFQGEDIFSGYVKALYKERSTPGPVGVVAKRLLNSLYGRTGMKREREQMMHEHGSLPAHPVKIVSRDLGIWLEPNDTMQHAPTIMPAVAATITARGRIALCETLRAAPEPAYCDTDSVVTGGKLPLEQSKEIGKWKIEAYIASADFVAPKAYRIVERNSNDEVLHAKGMPKKDINLLRKYLYGESVRIGRIPGLRESMRRGLALDGGAEHQTRQHAAGSNRHPDGRPYSVDELTRVTPSL